MERGKGAVNCGQETLDTLGIQQGKGLTYFPSPDHHTQAENEYLQQIKVRRIEGQGEEKKVPIQKCTIEGGKKKRLDGVQFLVSSMGEKRGPTLPLIFNNNRKKLRGGPKREKVCITAKTDNHVPSPVKKRKGKKLNRSFESEKKVGQDREGR